MPRKSGRRGGSVVTIHDVARHAGVSPMTVSRVINAESNVREETRAKVAASVKALRYSPNLAARSLASADALHLGILYANPSAASVSFGTRTTDEMCFDFITVYPYALATKRCASLF